MALKLRKYPKKPKGSASAATLQRYLDRCKAIDRENAQRKSEHTRREQLKKKVANVGRSK